MVEHISPDRIANAIMQDKSFVGTYILVEGNNDYTFYRKFVNNDLCEVQVTFGKQNILNVIKILQDRGFTNSIGIVDSDFRNISDISENPDNIFYTDEHDIETTIIKSEAFDSLIDQYCEKGRYNDFIKENNDEDLRKILLKLLVPLGYLKWANQREKWGLLFKAKNMSGPELKIEDFIPVATMQFLGYEKMINTVFNYSRGKVKFDIKEDYAFKHVEALSTTLRVDDYQLCNGHDFSYLFSLALRKKISNYNSKAIPVEQIEKDLVLAYDSSQFKTTNLYSSIEKWQTLNSKIILKF
ncbi:hypothetical protein ACFGVR_00730 [Mucilaginibacter sp. AW1-3]